MGHERPAEVGRVEDQEYEMFVLNSINATNSIKLTEVGSELSGKADLTGSDDVTCTSRSRP